MPATREDMAQLHGALSRGDTDAASQIAVIFSPEMQQAVQQDPQGVMGRLESRAGDIGLDLAPAPSAGGATRGWTPESAGIPRAYMQGVQRGGLGGSGFFGVGAPEGAPPVEGLAQNVAQGVGMATPLAASLFSGGTAAGPIAGRLAATKGPGILAALIRALGPSAVRGLLGEAGFEAASAAGGVKREPGQVATNIAAGTLAGPAAGLARRALPAGRGAGGAIRRLRGGPAVPTAGPVAPAAAIPEAGAGQVGGEVAEAGGDVTARARAAVDQELASIRDPNNVLAPETTGAATRAKASTITAGPLDFASIHPSMVKSEKAAKGFLTSPQGEAPKAMHELPLFSETRLRGRAAEAGKKEKAVISKKPTPPKPKVEAAAKPAKPTPPKRKAPAKKLGPPKRRKGTASERLREKARREELG